MPSKTGFDISDLLDFHPPLYLCKKCLALLRDSQLKVKDYKPFICPVCKVQYTQTEWEPDITSFELWETSRYLEQEGYLIRINNTLNHCRRLALIANQMRQQDQKYPPFRGLLEALSYAQSFVHFITFGEWRSHIMVGALKVTAQRVPVRGIISGVDTRTLSELTEYQYEAPAMEVRPYKF